MDAMRGIAFLYVFVYHSVFQSNLQYRHGNPFNALGYEMPVAVPAVGSKTRIQPLHRSAKKYLPV